jgi:hypothetical protein
MKSFCGLNRPRDDECARQDTILQNEAIIGRTITNLYPTNGRNSQCRQALYDLHNFSCANESIRFKDGIGNVNVCDVDADTKIKRGISTNVPEKCQLLPRVFHAVPSLDRGGLFPDIESRLKSGGVAPCNTSRCPAQIEEQQFDRFIPFVPCMQQRVQNVNHIIPSWTWGGEPSRDIARSHQFLEACGYEYDGKIWHKKS